MKCAKRFLSLLLPLMMLLTMIPATALAADTITITVRVFDQTSGKAYEVGTDTVNKATSGIQSQPYQIKELSAFTQGTYKTLDKVAGNWYFPTGDMNVGSNVYFSNNASTATITYWVREYKPYTEPVTPPGDSTPPSTDPNMIQKGTAGATKNVWMYVQVVYANYDKTGYTYGPKKQVYLDCQGSSCKHTLNCSIRLKDFHPTAIGLQETMNGCKWIGWSKNSVNLTPQFGTFYSWTNQTTNLANPSQNVYYLIYQSTTQPTPGESGDPAVSITLTFHDGTETATQSGLSGDSFTMPTHLVDASERDGYAFLGWSTTENAAEPEYLATQQAAFTANTDLYAVWKENVRTENWEIRFDSGLTGVTVSNLPETQYASHEVGTGSITVTLPAQVPATEKPYAFQGWTVEGDDSGTVYLAGSSITLTQSETTLVAKWKSLDVDGDGQMTYLDAMTVMDYLSGNATFTADQIAAADFNGDGLVDYLDAMAIMDALAGSH